MVRGVDAPEENSKIKRFPFTSKHTSLASFDKTGDDGHNIQGRDTQRQRLGQLALRDKGSNPSGDRCVPAGTLHPKHFP